MIHGLIVADNTYSSLHVGVNRAPGAHRIATHLRNHGYNIEVVDYCLRWTVEEFQQLCRKVVTNETLFLGIGASLFFDKPVLNDQLNWFKKEYPNIPIVLGGSNVINRDIVPVDYIVDGYAEQAVLELMQVLQKNKKQSDLILSRKLDQTYIDCNHCYSNIDTSDLSIKYLPSDFIVKDQVLGLETARGCIFKCKFCTYPLLGKKKVDYLRDPVSLEQELKSNYDQWGATKYIICEDTLNDSVHKLREMEKVISKLPFNIEFVAYSRLDLMIKHPEMLDLLKSMGMKGVHFGIETFNPKAAKIIGKSSNIEQIKDGLLWFREAAPEINIQAGTIIGLPEDDDDHWENVKWWEKSGVDFYYFNPLYLTNADKVVNTSEFSRNHEKYGFVPMADSEIEEEIEKDLGNAGSFMKNRNAVFLMHKNKKQLDKVILWKNVNNGDNYFKATRLAVALSESCKNRKSMSWTAFEYASLGYSIDEIRSWNTYKDAETNRIPEEEINHKAEIHINNYKKQKLAFNYEKFYNGK